jgi:hypothetical protein
LKTIEDMSNIIGAEDELIRVKLFMDTYDGDCPIDSLLIMWMSQLLRYYYRTIINHLGECDKCYAIKDFSGVTLMGMAIEISKIMQMEASRSLEILNNLVNIDSTHNVM